MPKELAATTVVRLNVGGVNYNTTAGTLRKEPESLLAAAVNGAMSLSTDSAGAIQAEGETAFFVDRDGELFRYVLDFLRTGKLLLPTNFAEGTRLKEEAKFYRLSGLQKAIRTDRQCLSPKTTPPSSKTNGSNADDNSSSSTGYITLGYRGTFAFGRDGQADVKFRKLNRILVCGKAALCREVFGDTLNESRDPDREGTERYTNRLYLKHQSLEKAFDELADKGFRLSASCASGANGLSGGFGAGSGLPLIPSSSGGSGSEGVPRSNADWEEQRWSHYTEFVFCRHNGK